MADQSESFKDKFSNAIGIFSGSRFLRAIMAAGYSLSLFLLLVLFS